MGIKQLFNKAAKGVKTFFKKDGTLEGLFNKGTAIYDKGSSLFDKGSALFDKGISGALNIGGQIGRTARDLAPALSAFYPELGLAAMAVGNMADKGTNFLNKVRNKKEDITNKANDIRNKISDARNKIMIPKPIEPIEESNEPEINFA